MVVYLKRVVDRDIVHRCLLGISMAFNNVKRDTVFLWLFNYKRVVDRDIVHKCLLGISMAFINNVKRYSVSVVV